MKTNQKRPILMLAFVALCTYIVSAQQISVGARVGYAGSSLSTPNIPANIKDFVSTLPTIDVGAVVEFKLNDHFMLQPELAYVEKGFRLKEGFGLDILNIPNLPVGIRADTRLRYLELPLLAKYEAGSSNFKWYMLAGPTLGYAMSGSIKTTANVLVNINLGTVPINLSSIGGERFEVSGTIGGGASMQAGNLKLFADVRYTHGFTSLSNISVVDLDIQNRRIGINAGILVPINNK